MTGFQVMSVAEESTERIHPSSAPAELLAEHVARYRFASRFVASRRVLDLGCGTGYGASMLQAAGARKVVGLDLAIEALGGTHAPHGGDSSLLVAGDARRLPLPTASFDCVVCFEVIEHLDSWEAMLDEVCRILQHGGLLIVSTPNRVTYSADTPEKVNPFHVHEFERQELETAIATRFSGHGIYGQVIVEAVAFEALEREATTRLRSQRAPRDVVIDGSGAREEPDYFVVVAWSPRDKQGGWLSRRLDPRNREGRLALPRGVWYSAPIDFVRRLRLTIRETQRDLDEKRAWALRLDQEIHQREAEIQRLQAELEDKVQWARDLEAESERKNRVVRELQESLDQRTAWAHELDEEVNQLRHLLEARAGLEPMP